MAHCYDKDGNPHFNLTPAQAKKEGLFFSVTEHQGILAKKPLELWKLGQHLKTAFKYPPRNGEDEQSFIKRVKGITWKNGGGAAELGTAIHAGIESVLNKEKKVEDLDVDLRKYVAPAIRYFESKKFEILDVEKVVVNEKQGYAGTADAVGKTPCGKKFILDWKSRKFGNRKVVPYDGQPEQVSAYGAGYFGEDAVKNEEVWGINVFVSTDRFTSDGESEVVVTSYSPKDMAKNYETFCLVCEIWRRVEKYDPRKECA